MALVKAFCNCMKAFLASKVGKSVSKELTLAKFWTFTKSDFLGLVNYSFLDLANFAVVDRFLKLTPTSTTSII